MATGLRRVYFETSAVNWAQERWPWQTAVNTRAFQNLRRATGFYISPLVIFEMLSTKNDDRREELIFFAQHLFEPVLLPSPEELIVEFVEAGCPRFEPFRDLASKGQMAEHWRRICEDRRKTLLYDVEQIAGVHKALRELSRQLFEFYEHRAKLTHKRDGLVGMTLTVSELIQKYRLIPPEHADDPESWSFFGLVTALVLLMFCGGLTVDRQPIEAFWSRRGIPDVTTRIEYTFTRFPQLVEFGPFHLLALAVNAHTGARFSRGMMYDSMHSLYAFYADRFVTADHHFAGLRDRAPAESPMRKKIFLMEELEVTHVDVGEPPEPKGWFNP